MDAIAKLGVSLAWCLSSKAQIAFDLNPIIELTDDLDSDINNVLSPFPSLAYPDAASESPAYHGAFSLYPEQW